MELLLFYSLRNLLARKLTSILTALGMGLVVFVFAAVLMLAEGLERTLVATGSPENAVAIRASSESEVQSSVERSQAAVIASRPEIALRGDATPLASKELVVLMVLEKRSGVKSNVVIRGIDENSLPLRPQVKVIMGRPPRPGSHEVLVGKNVARDFLGVELGSPLRMANRDWRVSGIFDAGETGFSSEVWGDVNQLMQAFRRQAYSSVLARLRSPEMLASFAQGIEDDPRLTQEAMAETAYYAKQSEMMAMFLRILGLTLTVIFSIGAVVGAMITMFAAVAGRVGEIGTLRALGFHRRTILLAFLMESLFLGGLGGLFGIAAAALLTSVDVSTTNFQTFSELAFRFTLTPAIAAQAVAFSLAMGLLGGVIPSFRASRMRLVEALRQV